MYRVAIEALREWKANERRKPLIIRGARQVGKTWLMKEFGGSDFERAVYVNMDGNRRMKELFSRDFDVRRLIAGLELYDGRGIDPRNTLIIFDEVQEAPAALAALKYFHEDAPEYRIVCAGSLLGVALHPGTSFPVGKVEFLDLHPLSFSEFMRAMGKERFVSLLEQGDFAMAATFRDEYIDLLKLYYYVGGMPEAVSVFAESGDFNKAREAQTHILAAYEQDFSKHAPLADVPRVRMLWNSIPAQLGKENKKFIYGLVREGARAREYERALMWLTDCGLVHKVCRVSAPSLPLKAYEDLKAFKLYLSDVGLLSCMTRLRQETLLDGNGLFKEFKGALTEQYVLQQLKTLSSVETYYWANERNTSEVDFLLDTGNAAVPLEVKAEVNLQSKSLKAFAEKYRPHVSVRVSMTDYRREAWLVNLPLYAVGHVLSHV